MEHSGDESGLRLHVVSADVMNLPVPDHRHQASNPPMSRLAVGKLPRPSPSRTTHKPWR